MDKLIDFSAELIEPSAIKAAGYVGVIGYFSDSRPGAHFGAKPLRREYCDSLRAAGLEIVTNYQFGKGDTSDWLGGFDAGRRHAEIALRFHTEAGGPDGRPLYAPVDANPTLTQWNELIAPFLRGWASVVGLDRTGMYGNARSIDWALEDGVARWFWQHNWSGDPSINGDHPAAHLHQIEIDQRKVSGVGVDVNTVLKSDYGQWSRQETQPGGNIMAKPSYTEKQMWSPNNHQDNSRHVLWFLLHTQEGDGTAESLARFLCNPASQVSYHYTVDNDGKVYDVVDTDRNSWSVLNGNNRSINLAFAGSRAAWSRDQWFAEMQHAIDIAAWIAVQDCKKYDIPLRRIDSAAVGRDEKGIADHWAYTVGHNDGSHTDVGKNFPWDYFMGKVLEFSGSSARLPGLDDGVTDLWHQLLGPQGVGWPQLSNRTAVDALATIGEKLGVSGMLPPADHMVQVPMPDSLEGRAVDLWVQFRGLDGRGWAQLGGRSFVDGIAAVGENLGLPGFNPPTP